MARCLLGSGRLILSLSKWEQVPHSFHWPDWPSPESYYKDHNAYRICRPSALHPWKSYRLENGVLFLFFLWQFCYFLIAAFSNDSLHQKKYLPSSSIFWTLVLDQRTQVWRWEALLFRFPKQWKHKRLRRQVHGSSAYPTIQPDTTRHHRSNFHLASDLMPFMAGTKYASSLRWPIWR